MQRARITADRLVNGKIIELNGSKSLSNRVLIIRKLCGEPFHISNLSDCDDTTILHDMLDQSFDTVFDAGHAGTSFRFMTAYLAIQPDTQYLTGSDRMKQRPIGPLVEALRMLGAHIEYTEKDGYPPLKIHGFNTQNYQNHIKIDGSISSQYLSALLMIAPTLPKGLKLSIEGSLVSKPYLEMTLSLMEYFGVKHKWTSEYSVHVPKQNYKGQDYRVEADWSAASYFYGIVSASAGLHLGLKGLFRESLQGDCAIKSMANHFGVSSYFDDKDVLWLQKSGNDLPPHLEFNLIKTPDLAQTLAVMSGALGIECFFSGLQTLKIKETDRISALKNELSRVRVGFIKLPSKFSKKTGEPYYMTSGRAKTDHIPLFYTYKDHRMAMAFTILASLFPIEIEDPGVVKKSYPRFWDDLKKIGFTLKMVN